MIGTVCRLRLGNTEDQLQAAEAELQRTKGELACKTYQVSFFVSCM